MTQTAATTASPAPTRDARLPHAAPARARGADPAAADWGLVLLHGRGDSALGIAPLGEMLGADPARVAARMPQADAGTWYPQRFIAPRAANEPFLSGALAAVDRAVGSLVDGGLARERIVLAGFSQGACLALEYAARHAGHYGAVLAFTGGLIGPEPFTPPTLDDARAFAGTPVVISGSARDVHVPADRMRASAEWFSAHGAAVDLSLEPDGAHTVRPREIARARARLTALDLPA